MKHLLLTKADIAKFKPYLCDTYLQRTFIFERLTNGETFKDYPSCISDTDLTNLKEKNELLLEKSNKTHFTVRESISLQIRVKNIQKLLINIFEVNTVNYCKEFLKNFNDDIDLDGLVPKESIVHDFSQRAPIISKVETFKFENMNRRGVFIIEFLGNGLTTRAIVYKGSLNLLTTQTSDGVTFSILDENKDICYSDEPAIPEERVSGGPTVIQNVEMGKTGIIVDGRIFDVGESGKIKLPFAVGGYQEQKIVVFHENFAQIKEFAIPSENFSFDGV
jgi:hypothetical protein